MTPTTREPVLSEEELARAAATLVGVLGLLGVVGIGLVEIVKPSSLPRPYHPVPVIALSAGSLVAAFALRRFPRLVRPRWNALALAVAAGGISAVSWMVGPAFSAYPAMSFMWVGMAAQLLLSRARALGLIGLVGLLYGVQVAVQRGNANPATRWILVEGAVLVASVVVGTLGDHIHHLRESERALRLEVEEATVHLEEAGRQRREFLAGMSHELRTPLNAIIGFADVISEELFGPLSAAQRPLVDSIRAAGERLLSLVREVLDLDAPAPLAPPAEPPASPPDHGSLIEADPRGALAFFVLLPFALLTMAHTPPHFHLGTIIAVAAVGVTIDMTVLLTKVLPTRFVAAAHLAIVTVVVFVIAMAAGGALSPFATMFFAWMATAGTIRLSPRAAAALLVSIAGFEAIIVSVQPGNPAAAWRWAATTGTVVASGIVIRMVVERLFEAADLEATMRWAADETRAALEATNQHKVEFLRNVRQELRWPVDEVTAAARQLLDGSRGVLDPRQAEYAADIAGAGDHLWSLITDILDLATIESGGMTVQVDDVLVADVLHDAVGDHNVHELDVEPSGARVWTDRDKLRRSVAGLVSNAVKFTPAGGRISLRALVDNRQLVITVTDTGRGIPAEDHARIFEGFQQGTSAMVAPGAGVGLTLARRFVEMQGGRLDLASEPGIGSTFTITLPVFERPMLEGAPVA